VKKLMLATIILAIGAGVGWSYLKFHHDDKHTLTLYGNVDIREVNLGFRVAGKLSKLAYDEGDPVKQGDVLAQLDDEPYRNQVARAAAQAQSLKEHLRLLETGNRPQEIAQAKALLHEHEVATANARRLFQRAEQSALAKGISNQERDNAEAGFLEADAQLASARQNLSLLTAGFRVEDIAQAKADLAQAKAALADARLQQQDTTLTAPSDGIIFTRAQEAGAILPVGATVFTLSLQNPVWIRAYVHEPDLGHIHIGGKVTIVNDSHPDQHYNGHIGFISPRAEFTPKTVETAQLRTALVYRLRVVVDNPDHGLLQGMPVTIRLATQP